MPRGLYAQYPEGYSEKPRSEFGYDHKLHAWTHGQLDNMNELTWDAEALTPTQYQKKLGAAAQMTYPGETASYLEDESKKKAAWTHEQFDFMNEKDWEAETNAPSGYQVLPGLAQIQHPGETNSRIDLYNHKEHAWSFEQLEAMNPDTWDEETNNPSHYQVTPYSLIETDKDDNDKGSGCGCSGLAQDESEPDSSDDEDEGKGGCGCKGL